ncbi:MAG TPA: hypothetical protein VFD51_01590 [Patescibacteria group bacterium]|nr:hypothetical protein [Patescibacteria group bacterium]
MKLTNIFNKNKPKTYFDLSSKDRKRIVTGAVRKANAEQYAMVKKYSKDVARCDVSR